MICPECGQECIGVWVDFGIGAYEYWGATGFDSQKEFVTQCCEVPLPEWPDGFDD